MAVGKGDLVGAEALYLKAGREYKLTCLDSLEEGIIRREYADVLVRRDKLPLAVKQMKVLVV